MTLFIHNKSTGDKFEFHYEDAIVDGEYVCLGRAPVDKQQVWRSRNVDIEASEGDWIYSLCQTDQKGKQEHSMGISPSRKDSLW